MRAETRGTRARFGVAPLHDGRVHRFTVHTTREPTSAAPQRDRLLALYGHWQEPIPALLAGTPTAAIQCLPIRELADDPGTFLRGRTVLVGDAAHAMTPNLGQGACQELEDAAALVSLLTRRDTGPGPGLEGLAQLLAKTTASGAVRCSAWRGCPGGWARLPMQVEPGSPPCSTPSSD